MSTEDKTVSVPIKSLLNLFAAGNWGPHTDGHITAVEFAKNAIEHSIFEMKMIAECMIHSEDRPFGEQEIYCRCYALTEQMQAAIELMGALEREAAR